MKKFILLLITGTISTIAFAVNNEFYKEKLRTDMANARAKITEINKANAQNDIVYKPRKITTYDWNGYNSTWINPEITNITYYDDGKVKSETLFPRKIEYTYNANGQVASLTLYTVGYGAPIFERQYSYEYDDVVTDFVVMESVVSDFYRISYGTEIIRNEAGNITSMQEYNVYENGEVEYDSSEIVINYNDQNIANEIIYYIDSQPLAPATGDNSPDTTRNVFSHLYNIEWENTDGQILNAFDELDALSPFYFGANRIKKANYTRRGYSQTPEINVDYDGKSFHQKIMWEGEIIASVDYTFTDSNDSFKYSQYDARSGYTTKRDKEKIFDSYQNILRYEEFYSNSSNRPQHYLQIGNVTYDDTYGYPLEYILQETNNDSYTLKGANDEGELKNTLRHVWSDYIPLSATDVITTDPTDITEEYYDINGFKTEKPTNGLYIVRKGSTVYKKIFK